MIIFPAIDIQDGNAVRLRQGKKDQATIFGEDPVAIARQWQEQGAEWLHIVDLDGAFSGSRANAEIIGQIILATGLPVQIGGGIRNIDDAARYMDKGAGRLIIGTIALEDPHKFRDIAIHWPGRIGVSLDAENGHLKSRGWVKDAGLAIDEALAMLEESGAAFIIYTDIARDGMRTGPNIAALESLLSKTTLPVIAAGGIAISDDIRQLKSLERFANFEGVISGRALYEGSLDLREAIEIAKSTSCQL